jgi:hypothetical protein
LCSAMEVYCGACCGEGLLCRFAVAGGFIAARALLQCICLFGIMFWMVTLNRRDDKRVSHGAGSWMPVKRWALWSIF